MLERSGALEGVSVLELSDDVGASYAAQCLATMGADVVRVIMPGRERATYVDSRSVTDEYSAAEVSLERFSRRIELPAGQEEQRVCLAELLSDRDVVITDFRPDELRALGMHWEDVHRDLPEVVYAHVSVFGADGPHAGWLGGDLEAEAASAVAGSLGSPDREPLVMPFKTALMHAGLQAAAATATSIYARALGREGAFIDISAMQVMASDVRNYSSIVTYYGFSLKRSGRRPDGSMGRYPTAVFPCKDGYVVITVRSNEQYLSLLDEMGNPEWMLRPGYRNSHNVANHHADEVDGYLIPWLMERTRNELVEMGRQRKVPIGSLARLDEVLEDEQYRFRCFFGTHEFEGHTFVLPGNPAVVTDSV